MDALSTVMTIARGCGQEEMMESVYECALRLLNKNWQHLQEVVQQTCPTFSATFSTAQICQRVPHQLPLSVSYYVLSSLLHLHDYLEQLSLNPSQ